MIPDNPNKKIRVGTVMIMIQMSNCAENGTAQLLLQETLERSTCMVWIRYAHVGKDLCFQ